MKPKYGFSTYAKSKIPLNHHLSKTTKTPVEPECKLLPHGFRVGEKVYYIAFDNTPIYGTVVDYVSPFADQTDYVWCFWEPEPNRPTYMPKNRVFAAGDFQF